MKHLALLAALALASVALSACSLLPWWGPGSMDLTVRGAELDDVISIYLIVGDNPDLTDLESEKTIDRVVLTDRQAKYVTFGQFKPQPTNNSWTLQQLLLKTDEDKVEVKVAKKAPHLEIEIHRKVLEARPELAAVLVVNTRSKGWGASQVIKNNEIKSIDSLVLDLRGSTITVHDKSNGSTTLPSSIPK